MRSLVRHQAQAGAAADAALAEEDLAGMLHAAAHAGRLDARQLLIGVRADVVVEEFDGLAERFFQGDDGVFAVLGKDPRLQWDAGRGSEMARGELRHADVVQPRGDGHRLLPMRTAAAIAEIEFLLQEAVRDHLILRWRGDDEFAGGLVGGMIHRG